VNPSHAPAVIGALIDLGATEDYVVSVLGALRGGHQCPAEALVEETEKRNRLKVRNFSS
jgi:hypothetical protein